MRSSLGKYFRNVFFLLGIFLLFPFVTYAQTSNNPAADTQIWVKLNSQQVTQNRRIFMKLTRGTVDNQQNALVYIVECLDTTDDRVCTTGTVQGDNVIYQSDANLKKTQTVYRYQYRGLFRLDGKPVKNPVQTNQNGDIPTVYWESTIQGDVVRKFYGVNLIKGNIDVSKLPGLEKIHTGNIGGQQQAAFEVKVPTPVPTKKIVIGTASPSPAPQKDCEKNPDFCEKSNYLFSLKDPYGRVFDAVSLEPIPDAKITLLTQRNNGDFSFMSPKETTNAIINPWTTQEDGKFLFLAPSGTYQFEVILPNYSFPFTPNSLNPNYKKAYYELYYGKGFTDQNIVEINTVEHRDIPVIPKGEPYRAPVKLLGYMSELNKKTEQYEVTGRVSHPLTIIEVLGKKIDTNELTRTLTKVTADKWGFFSATIRTSILKQNEMVGMAKMTKVDLTQAAVASVSQKKSLSSFLVSLLKFLPYSSSFAEKEKPKIPEFTLARINPLLNYLEGYAYDTNSKLIPHAKVGIYLTGSKKPYYVGKADEKGYFTITSQHLPQMNYFIMYTTPEGKNYSITQSKFLMQNVKTIAAKNINVNKYLTQLSPFSVVAKEPSQIHNENKNPSVKNEKINNPSQNNNAVILTVLLVFIIISIVIGVILYLKTKKNSVK